MQNDPRDPEVVRVIGAHWLIDSRARLRTYRRRNHERLEPAYYVVTGPSAPSGSYNEGAGFSGPYDDPGAAHAAAARLAEQARQRDGGPEKPALLRPKPQGR